MKGLSKSTIEYIENVVGEKVRPFAQELEAETKKNAKRIDDIVIPIQTAAATKIYQELTKEGFVPEDHGYYKVPLDDAYPRARRAIGYNYRCFSYPAVKAITNRIVAILELGEIPAKDRISFIEDYKVTKEDVYEALRS